MSGRRDSHRLLLVHAHPDDESIGTGATIARYAAEGAQVTLVTCTRGELGEVIPPELAYLAIGGDRLGEYRITELAAACAALGISDQRFLGGPGRWRDSGMMGLPANDSPDCFWQADLATAAAELANVILDVRPQVLVTYDENGFYGHPDHIQAHRVARAAIGLAAGPGQDSPWQVAKFYATAMPRSVAEAEGVADFVPFVPDEQVTTEIDGTAYLAAKTAAMRAHATQIVVKGDSEGGTGRRAGGAGCFALSSGRWQPLLAREYYTLLAWGSTPPSGDTPEPDGPGTPRGPTRLPFPLHCAWPASRRPPSRELTGVSGAAPGTRERDLFAGLDGR
jgi:N-acetyl-1-D-myo-inositol-2-amino-2-deoxy-alpha-D-glucopyranoside deacetylase